MFDTKLVGYVLENSKAMSSTVATLDTWMTWSLMELQLGFFMDVNPGVNHFHGTIVGEQDQSWETGGPHLYATKATKSISKRHTVHHILQCPRMYA